VLDSIRKNAANSVVLKVLLGVIAIVFIFFYASTSGFSQLEVAARINDQLVTKTEVDRAARNLDSFYRNAAPGAMPSGTQIQAQALQQVINTELLVQEASNIGLEVDSQELRDSIASIPDFQIDGVFNKTRYLEALQLNQLKPADFEESQRRQVLTDKLLSLVRAGAPITDGEIEERYHFENDRITLRFIEIEASEFTDSVSFDDQQLGDFYEAQKEDFRQPEKTVIRYMAFLPEAFEEQVDPTDTDLEIYYDQHRNEYERQEQVRARHILLRSQPGASDEDKAALRERAVEIRKRALAGEDFAALAEETSEDSTAANGGDLGSFGRGVMTPAFESAAFDLDEGEISDLVETEFGVHVIKLEEKIPAGTSTLDEVRDEVRKAVQKRESRKLTLSKVEEAYERLLDGEPFPAVSDTYDVDIVDSDPFARGGLISGLGRQPEVVEAAFATDVDELGEIVNVNDGYLIFEVVKRIPSVVPPLDEIRADVESALRTKLATEAALTRARELLTTLQANGDIDALAEQESLEVEESGEIGRFGGYVPGVGNAPTLKDAAFALTEKAPVAPEAYEVGGDAVIAVLGNIIPAPEERLGSEKEAIEQRLRAQKEAQVVSDFIEELRDKSRVEIGQGYANLIDAEA